MYSQILLRQGFTTNTRRSFSSILRLQSWRTITTSNIAKNAYMGDGGNRPNDRRSQSPRDISQTDTSQEERLQFNMKEPLLDAGVANIFERDPNAMFISENLNTGFRLSNGNSVYGPVLVVNNEVFSLKIPPPKTNDAGKVLHPFEQMSALALKLFDIVTPKPDILVVGGGATSYPFSAECRKYLTSVGINVEYSNTRHASSTYNVLNEEGRNVSLLAIPLSVKV